MNKTVWGSVRRRIRFLQIAAMAAIFVALSPSSAEAKFKLKLPKIVQRLVAPVLHLPKDGPICHGFDRCFWDVAFPRLIGCTVKGDCPTVPGKPGQDPSHSDPPPAPFVTLQASPSTCVVPCTVLIRADVTPNRDSKYDWSGCVAWSSGGPNVQCNVQTVGTQTETVVVTNTEGLTGSATVSFTGRYPIAPDPLPIAALSTGGPPNQGASCNTCGGTIQSDGSCLPAAPANVGESCSVCSASSCEGDCSSAVSSAQQCACGTIDCSGMCTASAACPSYPHIASACIDGSCNMTCDPGWADCDGNKLSNGCEADLSKDLNNCNVCGMACGPCFGQFIPACVDGRCACVCGTGAQVTGGLRPECTL